MDINLNKANSIFFCGSWSNDEIPGAISRTGIDAYRNI
jgi:hypothetical protein